MNLSEPCNIIVGLPLPGSCRDHCHILTRPALITAMLSAAEPRREDQLIGCDARWQQVLLIGHVRAEAQSTLLALSEHKAFWENSRGPLIDTANNGQIMTPCTDSLTETRPKDSEHTHRETRTINITHRGLVQALCFKEIVHPKMTILSSFTHPVVPTLYECLCSAEHKGRYYEECGKQSSSGAPLTSIIFFFPTMEVNGAPK